MLPLIGALMAYGAYSGSKKKKVKSSGAFQDVGAIGNAFSDRLLERLTQSPEDTEAFKHGSGAIRDQLDAMFKTARQRLGDTATSGGFLDSGAVTSGMLDLERSEMQAYSTAIRDLFLALDDRSMEGVLPFLAAASGESVNMQNLNLQGSLGERGQNMDFTASIFNSIMSA